MKRRTPEQLDRLSDYCHARWMVPTGTGSFREKFCQYSLRTNWLTLYYRVRALQTGQPWAVVVHEPEPTKTTTLSPAEKGGRDERAPS